MPWSTGMEFKKRNTAKNGGTKTCNVRRSSSFVDSCNFANKANSHTFEVGNIYKANLIPFWPQCCESEAILDKPYIINN